MMRLDKKLARHLVSRANAARDARRYQDAAALYEEALLMDSANAAIHIQCGHMHKEAGQRSAAELHYAEARRLDPQDADLALQLGHFYKVGGRLDEARRAYSEAVALSPGWTVPQEELHHVEVLIARRAESRAGAPIGAEPLPGSSFVSIAPERLAQLVPALAPSPLTPQSLSEALVVRRIGRPEAGFWGRVQTLRGVEAVRGYAIAAVPIVEVQLFANGLRIHHERITIGRSLPEGVAAVPLGKYIFNLWVDFSEFPEGLYDLEIQIVDAAEKTRSHRERVVIAPPPNEEDWPDSDFVIRPAVGDRRPLDVQIRDRPSMIRPARRSLFPDGIRNLLVMRMDQLGDVVASIPALVRLRDLVPEARLVGLLTPANADLAATLGLFDEIIVVNFPDDPEERRRVMPLADQEALRARLAPYAFDVAIDLAQSGASRALLHLTGAKFTHATTGGDYAPPSSQFLSTTHDRWTLHDCTPHASKVLALIETFGALLHSRAPVMRRTDLTRDHLTAYGVGGDQSFILIHTGARIRFSQWPHYGELVERLLSETDHHIVMINDDPGVSATMKPALLNDSRLRVIDGKLPFDDFDALLSFAALVVGNDSGPKHLASLRGTPVVTLFSARINWTEWGQENIGTIISRKVPCAGCAILHDTDECGRDFACVRDIRVNEVLAAVQAQLGGGAG
jgi:ADP-heptose:LPS heptosyltransferase